MTYDLNKNNEYNDVLSKLHDYMLDKTNLDRSLQFMMKSTEDKQGNTKNNSINSLNLSSVKKESIFVPPEQDSLFWCFYILKNGDSKYESLYSRNDLVSKQNKIDLVTLIRNNKDIVKTYKLDTITNIESNLANDQFLNPKTFLTLCAIENINIIYISKKTYFELMMNDTDNIYIVYEITNTKYSKYSTKFGYILGNKEIIENIHSTLYKIDKIDKPIRALSYYKLEDLINICNKLAIKTTYNDTGKSKCKKDLYEALIQYF